MTKAIAPEDVGVFEIMLKDLGEDGEPLRSALALRREVVSSWAPSNRAENTTVVHTMDGKTFAVHVPFPAFHTWMVGARSGAYSGVGNAVSADFTKLPVADAPA